MPQYTTVLEKKKKVHKLRYSFREEVIARSRSPLSALARNEEALQEVS
jgi:hypothetical protein